MADITRASNSELLAEMSHWLNVQTRCFGDKGDVEDITEGEVPIIHFTPLYILLIY